MSEISKTKMYNIINKTVKAASDNFGNPIDGDMTKFGFEYRMRLNENIQLSLFDEQWPSKEEVVQAVGFCNCLEQYRQATDAYAKEIPELSENTWRLLYKYIQHFRPYVTGESSVILKGIERSTKNNLPEFRSAIILEDFNCRAERILQDKKKQKNSQTIFNISKMQQTY